MHISPQLNSPEDIDQSKFCC